MSKKIKNISITGIGIALFVVLSLCLQVPVFENYYLCLGYVVMAVYCYCVGTVSGTLVGVLGTVIYCIMIKGKRGMPGWALGNLIIGINLGIAFKVIKKLGKPKLEFFILVVAIIATTAAGILFAKSVLECVLYSQPILVRMANNIYGFIADAFVLIVSLPLCRFLEPHLKKYL